ncbi:carboxypeptidase-like regulatory domain-containing protein [Halomonas nitroreducens]|uniref:Carboxypeptidase regulatory-like domain-containing protein n=1 Tax=Halomonas nitroreducens TaxID=447425 RepID=A0A3S0HRK0_9GAMM|nr:carboxypeptidase-like regulatory domain-containing protein [Halomonas nitroreducens]RTR01931.1 carboxypeptidase regulatory-like domain-containing protein [Halomonas nitroreducens]
MLLTGILYDAGGPLASVTITFEATQTTQNGVILGADRGFTTNEDGTYAINLEPGHYAVFWNERGHRVRLGNLVADEFSESSLPAALQAAPTPVDSSAVEDAILEALQQMQADLDASRDARDAAQEAQAAAELARDAATVSGKVYADTAAGLADTLGGDYFKTPASTGDGFLTLYRNDAGSATEIETFPSLNGLTAAVAAANEQATRLNRAFSLRPYQGETLRLDFVNRAYGQGDVTGISQAFAVADLLTVTRTAEAWEWGPHGRLMRYAPDELAYAYDPVTGAPLGAVKRGDRTNLVPWSEALANWSQLSGFTEVLASAETAPRGEYSRVGNTDGAAAQSVYIAEFYSLAAKDYTFRFWFKPVGNATCVGVKLDSDNLRAVFNAADGTFDNYAGITINAIELQNGMGYEVTVQWTSLGGDNRILVQLQDTIGFSYSATIPAGEYAYLGGFQLSDRPFDGSYIPTEGAVVTRDLEEIYRPFGDEYQQQAGAVYVEFSRPLFPDGGGGFGVWLGSTTETNEYLGLIYFSVGAEALTSQNYYKGGGDQAVVSDNGQYVEYGNKLAASYGLGEHLGVSLNGTSAGYGTDVPTTQAPGNRLAFGCSSSGNATNCDIFLQLLELYPGPLSTAELETMTT